MKKTITCNTLQGTEGLVDEGPRCVRRKLAYYFSAVHINTLRTGLLNCLNARSRGLIFWHRASSI